MTAGLAGQHRLGWRPPIDTVFDELVRPNLLVLVQRRACHSEDQDEQDSFYVEGVSQRGAEQAETRVGECEEVRRGVEEADRRAADVEVTRGGDELPETAELRMRDDGGDSAECQWCLLAREFFSNRFGKAKSQGQVRERRQEGVWLGHGRRMKFSSERRQGSFELSLTDAEVRVQMVRGLDQKHAGHAAAARPDKTWSRNTGQGSTQ